MGGEAGVDDSAQRSVIDSDSERASVAASTQGRSVGVVCGSCSRTPCSRRTHFPRTALLLPGRSLVWPPPHPRSPLPIRLQLRLLFPFPLLFRAIIIGRTSCLRWETRRERRMQSGSNTPMQLHTQRQQRIQRSRVRRRQ